VKNQEELIVRFEEIEEEFANIDDEIKKMRIRFGIEVEIISKVLKESIVTDPGLFFAFLLGYQSNESN